MKRLITIWLMLLLVGIGYAQTGFSYQGLLRDSNEELRTNENLSLTVQLLHDHNVVYTETQDVTTNDYGVFSFIVGRGTSAEVYSSSLFLNSDSTQVKRIYLKVSEGETVISNSEVLGSPVAEVAKVALKAHIDFPAGSIIAFGGDISKIPNGWLLCDGTEVNCIDYPELFDAIGSNWGSSDINTFRVPDLQGVFLRGVNHESDDMFSDSHADQRTFRHSGGNSGASIGSYQVDSLKSHTHEIEIIGWRLQDHVNSTARNLYMPDATGTDKREIEESEGSETRPKNAYVNYIIKY